MSVSDELPLFIDTLNNPSGGAIYSEAPADGFLAAESFSDRSLNISDEQLTALTCGTASGNTTRGLRSWAQGFYSAAHQGGEDGLQGYDSRTVGGAIGTDTSNWIQNAVVGASLSYAHTNADARDTTQADTDIDSYQLTLYGDYKLGDQAFVRGLVGYGRSQNDTLRIQGGANRGSYGANEFTMLVKSGKAFKHDAMTVTPSMTARWVHYIPEDYNESGPNALHVEQDSVDVFEVGPSVDATWKVRSASGGWLVPSVHSGIRYDLADEAVSATYTGGGGPLVSTSPAPAQLRVNLGTSLTVYTTDSWQFKAGYDMDYRKNFLEHTTMLRGTIPY